MCNVCKVKHLIKNKSEIREKQATEMYRQNMHLIESKRYSKQAVHRYVWLLMEFIENELKKSWFSSDSLQGQSILQN